MVVRPLKLFATKEPKNLLNACESARLRSTVAVTSVASDAALGSAKQANARRQSVSFDHLDLHHVPSTKALKPSTSAPVSVGACSNVVIILAPSFATRDLVVAVARLFSTRSVVIAGGLFFSLHYLAAPTHLRADSIAKDRRTAVIRKFSTTVTEMRPPVLNVLS